MTAVAEADMDSAKRRSGFALRPAATLITHWSARWRSPVPR